VIRNANEFGALCRAERKRRGITLDELYASTQLSTRFLSEFERGKPHVSMSRVLQALQSVGLDVLVVPRKATSKLSQALHDEDV
jgi:transcriptional regulator with XRE-family HTH domain